MLNKNRLFTLLGIVFLFLLWYVLAIFTNNQNLLPYPHGVLLSAWQFILTASFWHTLLFTLTRCFTAFFISLLFASLLGVIYFRYSHFRSFIMPTVAALRSIPVISILLLIIIWFSPNSVAFIIGVVTMVPIFVTALFDGIDQTDKKLIEMADLYRISFVRKIREIHFPSVTPWLFSGASTALGFGWRAIIIGEVLSQPKFGIGSKMREAQSYLLISDLLVWTLVAVIFGYLFELVFQKLKTCIIVWR